MWRICVEEEVLFCSHSTWKTLKLQGAYHNDHFVHFYFFYENQLCPHWFFSVFHHLRQLLLWLLVIKGKIFLSSKLKFGKGYWISNKNNNVTCVIGWLFIILFSFSLDFICTFWCLLSDHATLILQKTWNVLRNEG